MSVQIGKMIFERQLAIMKQILRLGEFKFSKGTEQYKFFKENIMDAVYIGCKALLKDLEKEGILQKCECNGNLREGYSPCEYCSGCGFRSI